MTWDVIVIGAGPGGYHAAIRAAQLGRKVLVVEAGDIGGVCLNVGCIPTKALLHAAGELDRAEQASAFGLRFGRPEMDLKTLAAWRDGIRGKLTSGVASLLKHNGVEVRHGRARLAGGTDVIVDDERLAAHSLIIATGSEPATLPGLAFDGQRIVDSTAALNIEHGVPDQLLVIGGGAVGLEFASIYNRFGAHVTLVEAETQILPGADAEVVAALSDSLRGQGIDIRTETRAENVSIDDESVHMVLKDARGEDEPFTADRVLVAVGRRPLTEALDLAQAGVAVDGRGFIDVDERLQTGVKGIYAIGDCAGGSLLAHKAMAQGQVAAANAAGHRAAFDYQVAGVVYTEPEWAAVGLTEAQATAQGIDVVTGVFPLAASGRALSLGTTEGLIKLVGDAGDDRLLGAHIVGPGASELINEAVLALEMASTFTDVAATVHAHPTLSEGLKEAAEHAHGRAIHVGNRLPASGVIDARAATRGG